MTKRQWTFVGVLGVCMFLITPFIVAESAQRPYVRINQGAVRTETRSVTLHVLGPERVKDMRISNDGVFDTERWQIYKSKIDWTINFGRGIQRVYVQFRDTGGTVDRTVYQDSIYLAVPEQMNVSIAIDDGETVTETRYVTIYSDITTGVESVRFSENKDFVGAEWVDANAQRSFVLSSGSGTKTVYAEFRDANNKTKRAEDTIVYRETARALDSHSVLQGQGNAIYYYGLDGQIHPFFNSLIYFSWYDDFSQVVQVSNSKLGEYLVGTPVCMRAGTWLVKFDGFATVYAPETGCRLRPIYSEVEAYVLYGPQWAKRIASLPVFMRSHYIVVDPRADAVDDETEIDADGDGVPASVETEYGTKDTSDDSDSDRISDYEEIYYWFTDPKDNDSDDDGFSDGREILAGYSPLGNSQLGQIPQGTYQYPRGAVVRSPENNYLYIVNEAGEYQYIGRNTNDTVFVENKLSSRYVIDPPYDMTLSPINTSRYSRSVESIQYPSIYRQSNIYPL